MAVDAMALCITRPSAMYEYTTNIYHVSYWWRENVKMNTKYVVNGAMAMIVIALENDTWDKNTLCWCADSTFT